MVGTSSMSRADAWAEAKRLVVAEGYTYAQASEAAGLPKSTVQKRATRERWQDQKRTNTSYAATVRKLKSQLLEKAVAAAEGDKPELAPQLVYAWKQAEQAYPEHRYAPGEADPRAQLAVAEMVLTELVEFLEDDRAALAKLVPHLRDFAQHIENTITRRAA